ncbi:MAG: VCBS repeat-containing protein, partial [Anaerolineales bacterium]|nr:VCBS repeat-containing protein [Anaerolineales bacterium]
ANLENQLADTIWSSPALADLNADGHPEILVGTDEGNFDDTFPNGVGWVCPYAPPPGTTSGYCGGSLYGIDYTGNYVSGFPQYILEHIQSTPAIADVNGDGNLDIFVGTGTFYNLRSPDHPTNGFRLFGFDKNGNPLPGWEGGKATSGSTPASPVIGDIAGDGRPEILITTMDKKLHAWHADGTPVAGFPMTPVDQAGSSWTYDVGRSLVLGDYDGDGKQEIFLATAWSVSIVDGNGQMLTSVNNGGDGKPIYYAFNTLRNNPAIGDLDNDGKLELVAMNYAIHVWELPDSRPDTDWPMFKRDAARTSTVEEAAIALTTEEITVMQELGASGPIPYRVIIKNTGPGIMSWSATPNDTRLTAVPSSGTASRNNPGSTMININTTGLPLGTTYLGDVSFAATVDGQPISNSPTEVPVNVIVVEELYKAFLPLVVE